MYENGGVCEDPKQLEVCTELLAIQSRGWICSFSLDRILHHLKFISLGYISLCKSIFL